jgi:hypothetical protein
MPACRNRVLLPIFPPFADFKILDSMILVHFEKDHVERRIAANQQLPWRSPCYRKLEWCGLVLVGSERLQSA